MTSPQWRERFIGVGGEQGSMDFVWGFRKGMYRLKSLLFYIWKSSIYQKYNNIKLTTNHMLNTTGVLDYVLPIFF